MTERTRADEPFHSDLATVHGVAAARLSGNASDARLLVQRHLEEGVTSGRSLSEVWSSLFSAAVIALTDELVNRSIGEEVSPAALLTESAMRHALEPS
jgi:hypothetical protein